MIRLVLRCLLVLSPLAILLSCSSSSTVKQNTHEQLVIFFQDWRKFQQPRMIDGVPDYGVPAMKKQQSELLSWQERLQAFDTTGWPVKHQVDLYLVWAEMNGLDFDHRIMKPWVRDPAFYVWFYSSMPDVPEREGPNIAGAIELPFYKRPLSEGDAKEIAARLRLAPKVFAQARVNLIGSAKDLWLTGTRTIREQTEELTAFAESIKDNFPDLAKAANEAAAASDEFAEWLIAQAPKKNGLSGIGKNNYTWYVHNVHLTPYSWSEEKIVLERELARAHSGLRLAEFRNKELTPLIKVDNAEAYSKMLNDGVSDFLTFFEKQNVMTVKPYMDSAMRAQIQNYVDTKALRGFFDEVDYRDPMPMRAHHYHWIDKAREQLEPNESPIRQVPLLYNIFDSRAEGVATAMEELIMNAGMLANRPRAQELVYIMLAQRAARGLGSLYQHGMEMNFDEATRYASKWVPWGLLPSDGSTIQHEEQFYLQQPGYGSSYVIGKLDFDRLIAEYARQREGKFQMKEFMDEFNKVGIIPMPLIYWEMTGDKSMLEQATGKGTTNPLKRMFF
jgi:hypothetical protein